MAKSKKFAELPNNLTSSGLWKQLASEPDLQHALKELRAVASAIGAKISEVIPDFTDHSVVHMDALWGICDQVFKTEEMKKFSTSEAFILGCTFYIHDLGMALAATPDGKQELENSLPFRSIFERAIHAEGYDESSARVLAFKLAARELHASKAEKLIDEKLPGIDRFLLESTDLRSQWGEQIGMVAASHHWSLPEIDRRMGTRGKIPTPLGDNLDLGFIACALRIIDYAHINSDRASALDRILRSSIAADSLKHWKAQEYITGPSRDGNHLVYGSVRSISDVDGWWVFYEMASGLDREITAVAEYLRGRSISVSRFSLEGVKGVKNPQAFAALVPTHGFEPVDIRFRPDSMARLVTLLGGQTLYGNDRFAPIRELLQNARDAIALQKATDQLAGRVSDAGVITISVDAHDNGGELIVSDDGVGMDGHVITNYLLGIAADYWHSSDCYAEFPGAIASGFRPVGRFGIGFLSVFMIGNHVEVETQRRGQPRLVLKLYGVGRRGALETQHSSGRSGTSVRIRFPSESLVDFETLSSIVRAKAPMLDIPVTVLQQGSPETVEPLWWQRASQDELSDYVIDRSTVATTPSRERNRARRTGGETAEWTHTFSLLRRGRNIRLKDVDVTNRWPGQQPEAISDTFRVLAVPHLSQVVLCSKGFAVSTVQIPGITGIAEIGDVELNAARTEPLGWNSDEFRKGLVFHLRPHIQNSLDRLVHEGSIPSRFRFISQVGSLYGEELLEATTLPWISVLDALGQARLMSPSDFATFLRNNNEIILAYNNVDPWSMPSIARMRFPEARRGVPLVPVAGSPNGGEVTRSYSGQEVVTWGVLLDHFTASSDLRNTPLLLATLKLISATWDLSIEALVEANWSRHAGTICGRLVRG